MPKAYRLALRGMTLIELLVAFMVLLMLVGALVSLTTRSLETWTAGETRKDMYDRAQVVLDAICRDLRNTYVENEVYTNGMQELQPPLFACDPDRNRQPRLRFVRTGTPSAVAASPPPKIKTIIPPMYYAACWEVAYVMDPDPAKACLWRGVRPFTRSTVGNLLRNPDFADATDPLFAQNFTLVESGILHVGYKFWTQFTTTWEEGVATQKVGPNSKQRSGPELRWDSTRRYDRKFYFYRKHHDIHNPDFVYPAIVEITVVVESGTPETTGVRLAEGCDAASSVLRLSHTRGLPDPPAMVRIDNEWIEYDEKGMTELTRCRRAQRQTAAQPHSAGTAVRFGETFTTEVRIPAHREAQEP